MGCKNIKKLCERLVLSQSVTFVDGSLIINIPEGAYNNNEKYCIVIAQDIPETTTIGANVVITIGADTTQYPLLNCNCSNVQVCQISARTRYSTKVITNISSGVFKLLGKTNCNCCLYNKQAAPSLPVS